MADPHRQYGLRCPIHGFVALNDWEREIISQPAFQRLRRIRQLALTDLVYPGAMHTRFEHSLGVMHVATQFYDAIVMKSSDLLKSELAYTEDGLQRDKTLDRVRSALGDLVKAEEHAEKSWYKIGSADIPVASGGKKRIVKRLSDYSSVVARIKPIRKVMLFADQKDRDAARGTIATLQTRKARKKP